MTDANTNTPGSEAAPHADTGRAARLAEIQARWSRPMDNNRTGWTWCQTHRVYIAPLNGEQPCCTVAFLLDRLAEAERTATLFALEGVAHHRERMALREEVWKATDALAALRADRATVVAATLERAAKVVDALADESHEEAGRQFAGRSAEGEKLFMFAARELSRAAQKVRALALSDAKPAEKGR